MRVLAVYPGFGAHRALGIDVEQPCYLGRRQPGAKHGQIEQFLHAGAATGLDRITTGGTRTIRVMHRVENHVAQLDALLLAGGQPGPAHFMAMDQPDAFAADLWVVGNVSAAGNGRRQHIGSSRCSTVIRRSGAAPTDRAAEDAASIGPTEGTGVESRHSSAHQVVFFLRELADGTPTRRLAAAKGLGSVGARETLRQLMTAARADTDPSVRAAALRSIGRLAATDATGVLLVGLSDDEPQVRVAAARALPATDAAGAAVVAALAAALADDEWKVREAAARHLGRLGVASTEVIDALIGALATYGGWKLGIAWWAAYRALEQLAAQPVTVDRLRHGLRSAPAGASRYGCLLLLRRHAPDEIRALAVAALADSFPPVRRHAAYLLIERPHADNVAALTATLAAEQDERIRSTIEQALGSVGDRGSARPGVHQ